MSVRRYDFCCAIATTKKVHALFRAIGQEMAGDPKVQALQKTKAEIEALSKKDERRGW